MYAKCWEWWYGVLCHHFILPCVAACLRMLWHAYVHACMHGLCWYIHTYIHTTGDRRWECSFKSIYCTFCFRYVGEKYVDDRQYVSDVCRCLLWVCEKEEKEVKERRCPLLVCGLLSSLLCRCCWLLLYDHDYFCTTTTTTTTTYYCCLLILLLLTTTKTTPPRP